MGGWGMGLGTSFRPLCDCECVQGNVVWRALFMRGVGEYKDLMQPFFEVFGLVARKLDRANLYRSRCTLHYSDLTSRLAKNKTN